MNQRELILKISDETQMTVPEVECVYDSMVHILSETLGNGERVDMNPGLGVFIPKVWEQPGRNVNSPRTQIPACYKIRFRPGKVMEQKLKIPQDGDDEYEKNDY